MPEETPAAAPEEPQPEQQSGGAAAAAAYLAKEAEPRIDVFGKPKAKPAKAEPEDAPMPLRKLMLILFALMMACIVLVFFVLKDSIDDANARIRQLEAKIGARDTTTP